MTYDVCYYSLAGFASAVKLHQGDCLLAAIPLLTVLIASRDTAHQQQGALYAVVQIQGIPFLKAGDAINHIIAVHIQLSGGRGGVALVGPIGIQQLALSLFK